MNLTRRGALGALVTTAAGLGLSACGQELPKPHPPKADATAKPVLDSTRLETILKRIQTGLTAADKDRDPAKLTGYLNGPALRLRTAK